MLRSKIALTVLVCSLGLAVAAAPALFQDQEMPQPTKEHKELQKACGTWTGTIQMFIPEMPMEPAPAKETVTAFGPFFTRAEFTCELMGMPYTGTGFMGYDPAKGKYVGTWLDNMSPFMSVMEGTVDEETGAMTMRWMAPTMTGEMAPHRSVTTMSENAYTSTFYVGTGDEEVKMMVIDMKRAASAKTEVKDAPKSR